MEEIMAIVTYIRKDGEEGAINKTMFGKDMEQIKRKAKDYLKRRPELKIDSIDKV